MSANTTTEVSSEDAVLNAQIIAIDKTNAVLHNYIQTIYAGLTAHLAEYSDMSDKIQQWMDQQGDRMSLAQKQELWEKKVALYAMMKEMRKQFGDDVVNLFKMDDSGGKVWGEVIDQAQEGKEKKEAREREQAVEEKDGEQSKDEQEDAAGVGGYNDDAEEGNKEEDTVSGD
ncbi:hypothetical protein CONLIGDRAFT_687628 [Coniochaeta ligniaria NRRL 30616]|uniref:Uncharacterized protein n=1 Tax=Coniochaeta ligniaria NRRL 30616 TaxID=1408157 RepID=A0A1J7I4C2_9PEZI|nr:hypothetical protein CONLIGDRAFT_687628 [Coniochaeta ligniaria NRRL 30616]